MLAACFGGAAVPAKLGNLWLLNGSLRSGRSRVLSVWQTCGGGVRAGNERAGWSSGPNKCPGPPPQSIRLANPTKGSQVTLVGLANLSAPPSQSIRLANPTKGSQVTLVGLANLSAPALVC